MEPRETASVTREKAGMPEDGTAPPRSPPCSSSKPQVAREACFQVNALLDGFLDLQSLNICNFLSMTFIWILVLSPANVRRRPEL